MKDNILNKENINVCNYDHKRVHHLKILDQYYEDIESGLKTFEVRFNDRNYEVGDIIQFNVINDNKITLKQTLTKYLITYVLKDINYLKPGYLVMSIIPLKE